MKKFLLKNVDVKKFSNFIKRSSSLDNLIFITVKGNSLESVAYNINKTALKEVNTNVASYSEEIVNEYGDNIKIRFANASKVLQVLSLIQSDVANIAFDVAEDGFATKMTVYNEETSMNVATADDNAVAFLELPEVARVKVFENKDELLYKFDIDESEFKYMTQFFGLNKESVRVFFANFGEGVRISEVESTDDNVRTAINDIISDDDYEGFANFEKLYTKDLVMENYETAQEFGKHLACYNKQYFSWIDSDKTYTFEIHTNKIVVTSYDETSETKTSCALTPVTFA